MFTHYRTLLMDKDYQSLIPKQYQHIDVSQDRQPMSPISSWIIASEGIILGIRSAIKEQGESAVQVILLWYYANCGKSAMKVFIFIVNAFVARANLTIDPERNNEMIEVEKELICSVEHRRNNFWMKMVSVAVVMLVCTASCYHLY